MSPGRIRVGCAGWSLPATLADAFDAPGSHLQRYALRLDASEINSSFHRPHRPQTYARWAEAVPADFAFSAKLPKWITHERRLVDCAAALETFLAEASGLGERLACLLVQLPPSLAFDAPSAAAFFDLLRSTWPRGIALEPRHASWFTAQVDEWLAARGVSRVLADPVLHEAGRSPGGLQSLVYLRLHGAPRMYYSAYDDALLQALAQRIRVASEQGSAVWCIFDNTAGQAAAGNALRLKELLGLPG